MRDNTPVCTRQFCSYRDRPDEFAALGATVVGISAQDVDSHQGFAEKNTLTVPLLADVDGAVAKAYSAHGRMGTKRAVVVIDEDGLPRAELVQAPRSRLRGILGALVMAGRACAVVLSSALQRPRH